MRMDYYSVEQISEMLDIHPKTIQRYIREGKLRANKVGKSWRVTGHDLSVFVESDREEGVSSENKVASESIASSVVDITLVGKEYAIRIMNTLTAALNAKPPEYGRSSMQTQYIENEKMVRVTLWGGIRFMAVMMNTIAMLTEQNERE